MDLYRLLRAESIALVWAMASRPREFKNGNQIRHAVNFFAETKFPNNEEWNKAIWKIALNRWPLSEETKRKAKILLKNAHRRIDKRLEDYGMPKGGGHE